MAGTALHCGVPNVYATDAAALVLADLSLDGALALGKTHYRGVALSGDRPSRSTRRRRCLEFRGCVARRGEIDHARDGVAHDGVRQRHGASRRHARKSLDDI
jgi:hypothetical protein